MESASVLYAVYQRRLSCLNLVEERTHLFQWNQAILPFEENACTLGTVVQFVPFVCRLLPLGMLLLVTLVDIPPCKPRYQHCYCPYNYQSKRSKAQHWDKHSPCKQG